MGGQDRRVIGLFNRGNMTIEKYKRENASSDQAKEPSVPEMTKKAIKLLGASQQGQRNGFFLQVEGALIDKRSHASDAAQTLEETKAFDDAVAEAVRFAEQDGNTLVIPVPIRQSDSMLVCRCSGPACGCGLRGGPYHHWTASLPTDSSGRPS